MKYFAVVELKGKRDDAEGIVIPDSMGIFFFKAKEICPTEPDGFPGEMFADSLEEITADVEKTKAQFPDIEYRIFNWDNATKVI